VPKHTWPRRSAGRRAFFLTFSITQRDLFRHDRRGATGLAVVLGEAPVDAAGEQRGVAARSRRTRRAPYAARSGRFGARWACVTMQAVRRAQQALMY
jgi:hypothetical protein